MKKILAIMLALVMLLTLAACGGNKDNNGGKTPSGNDAEQTTDAPKDTSLAKGEWSNKSGAFALALVGAELFDDEDGEKAIRVYFDFTNKESSYTTSFTDEKNDITLTQNGEELDDTRAVYGEDVAEVENHKKNVRPGVTIRCVGEYVLNAETGKVALEVTAHNTDNAVLTYELDLAALPGAPKEAFVAKEIAAPDFNNGWAESGTITDYYKRDVKNGFAIKNAEFVDGVRDTKLIRVYFEFTNNREDSTDLFKSVDLRVYQDGIQLVEGQSNELCDSDLAFSNTVEPGQTVTVSNTYILTSDSPVEVEAYDTWQDSGLAKQFKVQ